MIRKVREAGTGVMSAEEQKRMMGTWHFVIVPNAKAIMSIVPIIYLHMNILLKEVSNNVN
jgi:hypothetical protein